MGARTTPEGEERAHGNPDRKDFLGAREIPDDAYYGVQTLRGTTAFRLALILRRGSHMDALTRLQGAFFAKGMEFEKVLEMGCTHPQDAVPMSLGQEFHGWGTTRIGKYVLNHSFMIPGVVATAVAVITGLFLERIMF